MKKFKDLLLNEYGGPNKTAGFRYSKPDVEYVFSVLVDIDRKLKPEQVKDYILEILKELKVNQEWFDFKREIDNQFIELMSDFDTYKLEIALKVYNYLDVVSMLSSIIKIIKDDKLDKTIIIDVESVNIDGDDLDDYVPQSIGFKFNKNEKNKK